MHSRSKVVVVVLTLIGSAHPSMAEQRSAQPARGTVAPPEAKQFDFLLGKWELTVRPAASSLFTVIRGGPKLLGSWKGWRTLDGWGFEDELRITDAAGNPRVLVHAIRLYDAMAHRWKNSTVDAYRDVIGSSTSQWIKGTMVTTTRETDAAGRSCLARATYSNITPTSFQWVQERSSDDGKSWAITLTIDAKRTAAAAPRWDRG